MQPTTLSASQLESVLAAVDSDNNQRGARQIVTYLAKHRSVRTRTINTECGVRNISSMVSRHINPAIESLGFFVAYTIPTREYDSQYSEQSRETEWSFYRAVANNPDHGDVVKFARMPNNSARPLSVDAFNEFKSELDTLNPDLPQKNTDEWLDSLSDGGDC